jgi:cation diffusion facilitator CzcD-associated flavoprotein CzcO
MVQYGVTLRTMNDAALDHVLIVGTGFAGLGIAIALKKAGIDDFTILEQADRVGGTWRDNHYPGAACDVQSHLYSFSFEPNPKWSRMFAPQAEILAYLEHCADKYDLRRHIRFGTAVTRATFDERRGVWTVDTRRDTSRDASDNTVRATSFEARTLVSGCGPLSRPVLPDIAGLASFAGKTFHSARWDHSFALEGKSVAVIGTGASAIQIVPAIAPRVGKLRVFQRTAPWIMPKPDREMRPRERALFARVPLAQRVRRLALYWQREALALGFVAKPGILKFAERFATSYLERSVSDPALRKKLTPDYRMGCKRILPSNDYYPALERPNVELVTDAIAEVRAHAIVTKDGVEHAVDAIVLATGFEAAEAVSPFEVRGKSGRELNAEWQRGPEAYLGTSVSGFPNLFLLVGPNTGLGHSSMILMIESQVRYIVSAIRTMRDQGVKLVDVLPEVQERYNTELQAKLPRTVWASGCKSWYQTKSGKNTTLWPGFTFAFRHRTRRFDPADYEIAPRDHTATHASQPEAPAHPHVATAHAEPPPDVALGAPAE